MKEQSSRIILICANCLKIRDDSGYWKHIEGCIEDDSEAKLSHGICPDCATKLYPEFYVKNEVTGKVQSRD
tara:strand:+ start:2161 stop:2373 length:213 start_codon:yes stop_codon:yes gene_type:complete